MTFTSSADAPVAAPGHPPTTPGPRRIHGFDAARAGALLLGIVLHSLMPFLPGVEWLANDNRRSGVAWAAVFVIHLFRMVLFMAIAGYFARASRRRKGTWAFLGDRVRRIALPMVAFWPVAVLPLAVLAYVNARVRGLPPATPPAFDYPVLLVVFSPGQLWFLWVLMQCIVVTLVARAVLHRLAGPDRMARWSPATGRLLSGPVGPVVAAVPYGVAVFLQGSPPGAGIVAPPTLLPEWQGLVGYLGAFLVGWMVQATPDGLARIGGRWPWQLGAAVVLTVVAFLATSPAATAPLGATVLDAGSGSRLLQSVLVGLAAWMLAFALLGLCVQRLSADRPVIRYLADASYWMYLIHLPLLVAIEIPLADLAWPILAKLVVTWIVSTAFMLVSYHYLVRATWLGGWLNGRRHPRGRLRDLARPGSS